MFVVEFLEVNPLTGKLYVPCGSANTRFFHCKTVRTVEKYLKYGYKPPHNTQQVRIFTTPDFLKDEMNFVKNFPVGLVGIDYIKL